MATVLKDNLSSGMNFLKRRFSSGDLYSERLSDDQDIARLKLNAVSPSSTPAASVKRLPTAPSFPSFSSVQGITKSLLSSAADTLTGGTPRVNLNKERCKVLLIIDDRNTEWARYFKGRKVCGDWDLRVEQAEFKQISIAAYSDSGATVDIEVTKNGNRVIQSFKPDFVLVRQAARHARESWKHIILALHYGGIPSVNSLLSLYNFLDKPWVFSHLLLIKKRLGSERFPLIEQAFYPNHREMLSNLWMVLPKLPVVVKIGHAHDGIGKVKVDDHYGFQDVASVMAVTDCYATTEPHVQAECDIYVQKIGSKYSAYVRKAMSGNWKANVGTATLEQTSVLDRYRLWVDECSQMFGGLDMISVKAVRASDGKEYIIEVSDSTMNLCGADDASIISELILSKIEIYCRSSSNGQIVNMVGGQPGPVSNGLPNHAQSPYESNFGPGRGVETVQEGLGGTHLPRRASSVISSTERIVGQNMKMARNSISGVSVPPARQPPQQLPPLQQYQLVPRATGPASPGTIEAITRDLQATEEPDDTMNNLRKTFAGIFNSINN